MDIKLNKHKEDFDFICCIDIDKSSILLFLSTKKSFVEKCPIKTNKTIIPIVFKAKEFKIVIRIPQFVRQIYCLDKKPKILVGNKIYLDEIKKKINLVHNYYMEELKYRVYSLCSVHKYQHSDSNMTRSDFHFSDKILEIEKTVAFLYPKSDLGHNFKTKNLKKQEILYNCLEQLDNIRNKLEE